MNRQTREDGRSKCPWDARHGKNMEESGESERGLFTTQSPPRRVKYPSVPLEYSPHVWGLKGWRWSRVRGAQGLWASFMPTSTSLTAPQPREMLQPPALTQGLGLLPFLNDLFILCTLVICLGVCVRVPSPLELELQTAASSRVGARN